MHNATTNDQPRIEAREALLQRGQSVMEFARLHLLNPSTVYAVLSGQSQGRRGESHRAAVLLGIKQGVVNTLNNQSTGKKLSCTKTRSESENTAPL